MGKPPFQFGLSRLLLFIGAFAAFLAVLRLLWGTMALVIGAAATGFACFISGAGKIETNSSVWSVLLVLLGVFLIAAAFCGGFVLQGIE